ncbi:MAG: cysteine--tRNA ligase [Granulosicoccus sp.]|nr:cysteine--tRNA ligase [Granulosicoccus sp.]
MLKLYDTLTREKRLFEPLHAGKVGMYVCGITVYDVCHVGHARAMIVYDVLYRHLLNLGFSVNYVRNITDVDDKIIRRAEQTDQSAIQVAERYIQEMREDESALSVLPPTHEPRATQTIDGMLVLIEQLIDAGHAYPAANGDVYYSVKSFDEYGKLSGRNLADLRAGERVAIDEHKRDPLDFVLWKSSKENEPSWESPWGPGRPGWHIECSAMSREMLGEEFDIHGGGIDLEFPHHENEIAQSEALTNGRFARYWVHNGMIRIDDVKMSKSLNNYLTIKDALKEYTGEELRTFILSSHYRSPVNYTRESMQSARSALRRFYTALRNIELLSDPPEDPLSKKFIVQFDKAMNDDLNTPEALAVLHELAGVLNKQDDAANRQAMATTLSALGQRLGLLNHPAEEVLQAHMPGEAAASRLTDDEINELILRRNQARQQKDYATSDQIRDELAAEGIVLEDADGATSWRR